MAFAELVERQADALHVSADGFLLTHLDQIVALAARHSVPTVYAFRQAITLGGLMSYGTDFPHAWRQAGVYTGRILKGEKPADLPVQQVTKMELIINLRTAKTLGLNVPHDANRARRRGDRIEYDDVRFWPLADISFCTAYVRFQGWSRHDFLRSPLLRSLSGVKPTWVGAPQMSASDPKRTFE